jgi:integrase
MSLTEFEIKNAKPDTRVYRMKDNDGLYLEVRPTGKRVWRMRYWFKGKENILTFGDYPIVSLKEARGKRDEARKLLTDSINPSIHRDISKTRINEPTFGDLALEFMAMKLKASDSEKSRYALEMRIKKHILPFIGNYHPDEITAPVLLSVVRRIEARGTLETAHRVHNICGQILRYGIATGRAARDTAADLRGALQPVPEKHFASITDTRELGGLLRAMDGYSGSSVVRSALVLLSYTFVRPGELRHVEWAEVNFDKAELRIAKEKMKMKHGVHIVPLARQSIALLEQLQPLTGHGRYIFPSHRSRSGSRPLSDNALIAALRSMGYSNDEMTAHGFRHTASTLLNESGLWNGDAIERQLAHIDRNRIRAVYNAAEYLPVRRQMMQWWADYLDKLRGDVKG